MKRALLAALVGAIIVILAYPTVGWALLMPVAWAPLLIAARTLTGRQRLIAGWAMGFVALAVLFRWIAFSLQELSGLPPAVGWTAVALFALWHGLWYGLFLWIAEPVRCAGEALRPGLGLLAVPSAFAAVEWVCPTLFNLALGSALWELPPVSAVAALAGGQGLSFVCVACSALVAEAWCSRGSHDSTASLGRRLMPTGVVLLVLLGFGVSWWGAHQVVEPRRVMKVGVLQINWTLEEKKRMTVKRRYALISRLEERLKEIPADTYDVLIASEGAYPLFWVVEEAPDPKVAGLVQAMGRIKRAVKEGPKTDLIIGGLRRPAEGEMRNAAVHIKPDGTLGGYYDKQVLMPFGEKIPGQDWFPALKGSVPGVGIFDAGDRPCRFEAAGEVFACGICYEGLFPEHTRGDISDASVLINLTIDTWFGRSTAPWFHLMVHAHRAAENGVPMLRSALTGISAIIGEDGSPDAHLGLDETGLLTAEVPLTDLTPPYRVVGPLFALLCVLMTAGLLWRSRPQAP
ncbi:MAG: apolipoprotein N-acyltransferase [Myxococcota bacterium]